MSGVVALKSASESYRRNLHRFRRYLTFETSALTWGRGSCNVDPEALRTFDVGWFVVPLALKSYSCQLGLKKSFTLRFTFIAMDLTISIDLIAPTL